MSKLAIGASAPDFKLFASDKSEFSLSSTRGKNVVLLFFPLAFTGVCTDELCSIRDGLSAYTNANAQVFGISVDSLFVLDKYKSELGLTFSLLSDFNAEVSRLYGTLYDTFPMFGMRNVSKRSAFVIDKAGKIAYAEVLEQAKDLPNFEKIQEVLKKLA